MGASPARPCGAGASGSETRCPFGRRPRVGRHEGGLGHPGRRRRQALREARGRVDGLHSRVVDEHADGLDLHRPRWIGAERDVLPSEPGVEELPGHYDRHVVMEILDGVVGGGRENHSGLVRVARCELRE